MTMKTNFLQPGSYNAIDIINQFKALFKDGVINVTGGSLSVSALGTPNMTVNVALGAALKAGLFLNSDAIVNVIITANASGYNRIDVIAVDLDNNIMVAVVGTPSSSPTAPILTANKIALAQVLVGNNVSVINTGNITDVRADFALYASKGFDTSAIATNAANLITSTGQVVVTTANGAGSGLFSTANAVYVLFAWDKGSANHLCAMGYKAASGTVHVLSMVQNIGLTLGASNSIGTQVITGVANGLGACLCIALPWSTLGI